MFDVSIRGKKLFAGIGVLLLMVVGLIAAADLLPATVGGGLAIAPESRVHWNQTSGPIGGVVNRMKTINGEVWASLYSGGIYKFANNRWQQIGIYHGLPENRAADFVVDPDNPKTVYAAQLVACLAKSMDGGNNWKGLCDSFLPQMKVDNYSSKSIVFDPKDRKKMYIAGKDYQERASIVMSPDQGKTWIMVHQFKEPLAINQLIFFRDHLYLSTESNGIYRSDDRGKTWTALSAGLDQMQTGHFVIDGGEKNLYLNTGLLQFNIREGGRAYVLDEAAKKWKTLGGLKGVTSMAWGNGTLWAGTLPGEIWKKDAKGWILMNEGAELPATVAEIVFTDSNTLFAGAMGFGIYRSKDDGKHFEDVSTDLIATATREVFVDPRNGKRIYVSSWDRPGIYYSENGGASFTVLGPDTFVMGMTVAPQDFSKIYASVFEPDGTETFYEVTARGTKTTWKKRTHPGPKSGIAKVIAVDPGNAAHVLLGLGSERAETPGGYGMYASRDSGKTWKKLPLPEKASYSILFNPKDPRVVYAALFADGVYKSSDGGDHWSKLGDKRLKYTYRMAMSPSDPNILLAGSQLFFAQLSTEEQISGKSGGIYKSIDGGAMWMEITAGVRNYEADAQGNFSVSLYNFGHLPNYEQMLIDPADHRHMLIGHHGENVFMTNDDGKTWVKQTSGMIPGEMHNYAYCLGADAAFQTIYACTCGRGLFSGKLGAGGKVSWRPVGFASVLQTDGMDDHPLPHSPKDASVARERILQGLYIDEH